MHVHSFMHSSLSKFFKRVLNLLPPLSPQSGQVSGAFPRSVRLDDDERLLLDASHQIDPFNARSLPNLSTIASLEDQHAHAKFAIVASLENILRLSFFRGEWFPQVAFGDSNRCIQLSLKDWRASAFLSQFKYYHNINHTL